MRYIFVILLCALAVGAVILLTEHFRGHTKKGNESKAADAGALLVGVFVGSMMLLGVTIDLWEQGGTTYQSVRNIVPIYSLLIGGGGRPWVLLEEGFSCAGRSCCIAC